MQCIKISLREKEVFMKKVIRTFLFLIVNTGLATGCANLVLVTERTAPVISELENVKTLGIARFTVFPEMNRYILMRVGDEEGATIIGESYPEGGRVVGVVVSAADAATKYYMSAHR